jgi:hypothetical protein
MTAVHKGNGRYASCVGVNSVKSRCEINKRELGANPARIVYTHAHTYHELTGAVMLLIENIPEFSPTLIKMNTNVTLLL